MMLQQYSRRDRVILMILTVALVITFVPWLGMTPFNTKGEPREAIVAVSMLQSGNWILPVSFGADIPYKPPFMAWCIAALSLPAGHVSEFTSRLPSAMAAIALCMMTCLFVSRRLGDMTRGAVTAAVLATTIEVWRAGMACRVDMLLTVFTVGALMSLYSWRERNWKGVPWAAIACMTCGVLTKGPVGMLLPCLVTGIYGLVRGDRFWPLLGRLTAAGLASLILPTAWYVAAYYQGGEEFKRLALEENVGRMTGTMSYSSHEKPLWYNFVTVALGMLPYTLLGMLALIAVKWKNDGSKERFGKYLRRFGKWLRSGDAAQVFCLLTVIIIFTFYCIPKSKRSVYLLPIYPFLAYYVVLMMQWLLGRKPQLLRVYGFVIATIALLTGLTVCFAPVLSRWVIVLHKLHLDEPTVVGMTVGVTALIAAVYLWHALWMRRSIWCERTSVCVTMITLWAVSGGVLPFTLSAKSDRPMAEAIAAKVPCGPVYSYVDIELLRYYTINYYLNDRVRLYERELPAEGYMIISEEDLGEWERKYGGAYKVDPVLIGKQPSCDRRQKAMLVRFCIPAADDALSR